MNVRTFIKAQIDEFNTKEKKIGNDHKEKEKKNIMKEKDDNLGEMTIIYQNRKLENINGKILKYIKETLNEEVSINKIFGEIIY